jgi:D-threo-aldose 1-dehydrogenase
LDPAATRRLGNTDLRLTQLGFGGAPLGELYVRVSEDDARATLAAAWELGVRFFDTAPLYGSGLSEQRMGRFLRSQEGHPFVLSTKVGRLLRRPTDSLVPKDPSWAGGLPFGYRYDYSYDGIMRSFEDSLQRLGLPGFDLAVVHDLDLRTHQPDDLSLHEAQLASSGWKALSELKRGGAVRAIGAGINEVGLISRLLDLVEMDFFLVAMRYTLLEQEILSPELAMCRDRGIGIVVGAVYNSGILATGAVPGAMYNYGPAPTAVLERVARMAAICARHDVPLGAVALQFPLAHPAVASVIPGAVSPDQVVANAENLQVRIPGSVWLELKAEGLVGEDAPTPS